MHFAFKAPLLQSVPYTPVTGGGDIGEHVGATTSGHGWGSVPVQAGGLPVQVYVDGKVVVDVL